MLSAVSRRTVPAISAAARSQAAIVSRGQAPAFPRALVAHQKATFFSKLWQGYRKVEIPTENRTGQEKLEMDWEFNREPIYPPNGAGTKENPIEVPSEFKERVVGFEHPTSHAIYWFSLKADSLCYVNDLGMYFKLVPLPSVLGDPLGDPEEEPKAA